MDAGLDYFLARIAKFFSMFAWNHLLTVELAQLLISFAIPTSSFIRFIDFYFQFTSSR